MAGGGIGEAALIGAAFGGAKAIATGDDPLQGALLGGVTSGALSGVSSALMANVPAGAENLVDKTVVNQGIDNAVANAPVTAEASQAIQAQNMLKPWAQEVGGINTAQGLGQTAAQGYQGAAQNMLQPYATEVGGINTAQGLGQTTAQGIASPANTMIGQNALPGGIQGGIPSAEQAARTATLNTATNAAPTFKEAFNEGLDLTKYTDPESMMGKGAQWWKDQGIGGRAMYAGLGGLGYGAYEMSKVKPEDPNANKKEKKSTLATFNPDIYQAYEAPRPDPYPQASYIDYFDRDRNAAQGGVMHSYAEGGIAALANQGMGGNQNYPQGRMDMTQYATPTQMPTSAEVVDTGYEQKTDPYTGNPVGFAEGGIASYGNGGQVYYDEYSGQYYTAPAQQSNPFGYSGVSMGGMGLGGMYGMLSYLNPNSSTYNTAAGKRYRDSLTWLGNGLNGKQQAQDMYQEPTPNVYRSRFQQNTQAPIMYQGPISGYAPDYSLSDSAALLNSVAPAAPAGQQMASGGIAGYSLGGYAAGGNPRLLKGPGDGMSDNIPAVIGDKQPARLADGEFVVPADVVSHLGNGSTDAGAKHLYAMMDKVRKARTGNKKQGKQIKPEKFLPT